MISLLHIKKTPVLFSVSVQPPDVLPNQDRKSLICKQRKNTFLPLLFYPVQDALIQRFPARMDFYQPVI